ncbi:MAG: hypothetical protein CSA62_09080 [Planctomycetota bacterium]|nr:MAG: hypothetical protein CSA62_09080 [Planctomycetota bacterium]
MAFVVGPRQVGKTTVCRGLSKELVYLNWDDELDRERILAGSQRLASDLGLDELRDEQPIVVLDELHKYRRWRGFLKGFYDRYKGRVQIVVTGSSRLDHYRRGGDSLMGRYFVYRLHPFSVGELRDPAWDTDLLRQPSKPKEAAWQALLRRGGFPEPYLRDDTRFSRRWQRLRTAQLVQGDIRDLTQIQDLAQLGSLVRILAKRSGSQLSYSSLAKQLRISVDTARRWIDTLYSLYHGFLLRPWFRNVARSLRKEPKWFLRDWSTIEDPGARSETFVACHLLKAVQVWEDLGLGSFELCYLRDKAKREVDFVVIRDEEPWFLVEAKSGSAGLSPNLRQFQEQLGAPHAFQLSMQAKFVAADPFERNDPCVVPARTLLSQLP